MRRFSTATLLVAVFSGGLVALPVTTSASAAPRPVASSLQQFPLSAGPALVGPVAGSPRGGPEGAASLSRPLSRTAGAPTAVRPAMLSGRLTTRPFSVMGVTWRADAAVGEVEVAVRHRRVAAAPTPGRWSAWETVDAEGDDAPDAVGVDAARTVRAGTAPVWTGPSDGVQVRLVSRSGAAPRDARIELIDPGAAPADTPSSRPRDTAEAGEGQPAVVSRAEWGADESIRRGTPSYNRTVKVGFVHHTASSNDYSPAQAAAMVRGIYAYHVKSNGWSDIGYNLLVDRFGRAYEGRAGGIDRYVVGAHTGGFNVDSFGVALLGDFSSVPPSDSTLRTLSEVLAWKLGTAYRDPLATASLRSAGGGTSKTAAGTSVSFRVVSGHRDAGNTSCPGATTYARFPSLRESVGSDLGAAFADPAVNATAFAQESRGPVTLSARTVGAVSWTATVTDQTGAELKSASGPPGPISFSWDLTRADGTAVPAGSYLLRLSGGSPSDAALTYSTSVVVGSSAGACRGTPLERAVCAARKRQAAAPR